MIFQEAEEELPDWKIPRGYRSPSIARQKPELPAPGKLKPNLPNNHLQYAITWFGLAAVLAGVFAVFARGRMREGRP